MRAREHRILQALDRLGEATYVPVAKWTGLPPHVVFTNLGQLDGLVEVVGVEEDDKMRRRRKIYRLTAAGFRYARMNYKSAQNKRGPL